MRVRTGHGRCLLSVGDSVDRSISTASAMLRLRMRRPITGMRVADTVFPVSTQRETVRFRAPCHQPHQTRGQRLLECPPENSCRPNVALESRDQAKTSERKPANGKRWPGIIHAIQAIRASERGHGRQRGRGSDGFDCVPKLTEALIPEVVARGVEGESDRSLCARSDVHTGAG
jgi:hypothetical protein